MREENLLNTAKKEIWFAGRTLTGNKYWMKAHKSQFVKARASDYGLARKLSAVQINNLNQ